MEKQKIKTKINKNYSFFKNKISNFIEDGKYVLVCAYPEILLCDTNNNPIN